MPTKRKLATKTTRSSSAAGSNVAMPLSSSSVQTLLLAGNPHPMSRRVYSNGATSSEGPLAVPLLEGLCCRPGVADDIIQDAFLRWNAGRLVARHVELLWRKHKTGLKSAKKGRGTRTGPPPSKRRRRGSGKKSNSQHQMEHQKQQQLKQEDEKQEARQQQQLQQSPHFRLPYRDRRCIHWLIRSLSSPSIKERRVAFQILTTGCPVDDTSIRNLIELLVFLIKDGNAFRDVDATCMVGWLTLLKLLVVRVLSGPERLAYCVRPDIGLTWLCRALWKVSSLSHRQKHPKTATVSVCLSLIDLIHSLVLMGTDNTIHQIHNTLWSEEKRSANDRQLISPMACLMGTYHLWAETIGSSKTVEEKYVTMMKQLIDPSLMPKIIPRSSSMNTDTNGNKKEQRLAFFLRKSRNDSSGSATNGKESKSSKTITKKSSRDRPSSSMSKGTNESDCANNVAIATSPGGNSMASSMIGSPPIGSDRSMVASVARLFSSLYGSNNSATGGDEVDAANAVQSSEDQELVEIYHGDHDIDGDGDHFLEPLTDDEGQEKEDESKKGNDDEDSYNSGDYVRRKEAANDDDENGEIGEENASAAGNAEDVTGEKNKVSESSEEKEDNDDNEDTSDNNENNSLGDNNDVNSEDDEEIDSDEGEDCNSMIDIEDDDEHDHDDDEDEIMIHEDELPQIEQGLLELQRDFNNRSAKPSSSNGKLSTSNVYPKILSGKGARKRSQLYIKAAMEVLAIQHPHILRSKIPQQDKEYAPLTIVAEKALMASIMHIVKPEKKPVDGKIILRRAPTQEEFFRGNHSKDIISFSTLKSSSGGSSQHEPTVRDLRQHIANDLQMGDSAELLEVLVANKILDVDLKLRVILQTVWKEHLIQHSGGTSSSSSLSSLLVGGARGGARSFLSSSSGLSLMLYSSLERSMGAAGSSSLSITAETPAEALPPMVMTYRLTGVDGEATEDTVSSLKDPEAPSESSSEEEMELLLEKEYGITRAVMAGRGVFCLLRSVQCNILHTLQKIRRDGIGGAENHARKIFKQSFYPGLSLLVCCAKLPSNRKLLLQARAPTTLLQLLLDVLDALEEDESTESSDSNSTATGLQELIEVLASDILLSNGDTSSDDSEENEIDEDASTLRLLIQAIQTSSLSRTLRNVIAKLVPYLTYGKPKLSKELASEFMVHVISDQLGEYEEEGAERRSNSEPQSVLTDTFIHASISLPANGVCNSLRTELLKCGFIERIARHILRDCPTEPPSWSPSLWSKGDETRKQKQLVLEKIWKEYSNRPGLKTSFEILIGLCKEHQPTQAFLGDLIEGDVCFLRFCHWLESTSDNTSMAITMKGFGLLAETLLDDIADFGKASSEEVKKIKCLRKMTRNRKKEIAMDRRKKSLMSMNKFGALSGPNCSGATSGVYPSSSGVRTAAPFWAPVLDLFRDSSTAQDPSESMEGATPPPSKKRKKSTGKDSANSPSAPDIVQPEWMKELENMEDETGLTCAVCQEGRRHKSTEMMGLYAYMKKVCIPHGDRSNLDGTSMLTNLPQRLPASLQDSFAVPEWYQSGKVAANELKESTLSTGASSNLSNRNRSNYYITTVCAGNAIFLSCHAKARLADRNHPKAPKSEWEGAALRNSRVKCNIIFPLVSSRSSSVSLGSVEQALTEHQTAVANMIGVRPKSNLWTVLHDVRLLLLRVAYGESLSVDSGGGSLRSNSQLIYHQLSMAKVFENEAQVDAPHTAQHARNLSAGFLAACEIAAAKDYNTSSGKTPLIRGIADSSLMAALTCILFHNTKEDCSSSDDASEKGSHPKRRWVIGKDLFLRGMLNCAGCRHALAIHSSGCISTRNVGKKRSRARSFAEWDIVNDDANDSHQASPATSRTTTSSSNRKSTSPQINSSRASIDDFGNALRPMIVYYAIMDQLSSDYSPDHDDEKIEECANRLAEVIETIQKAKSIHELLELAGITLPHNEIINELQRGMMSA